MKKSNIQDVLKERYLNVSKIIQNNTLNDLADSLEKLIKTEDQFKNLKLNDKYRENFFSLVSYLYLIEHNKSLKKNDKEQSLSTSIFDDEFAQRLNELNDDNHSSLLT